MRRTLFAFPRDLLPAVWGSASARVADPAAHPVRQGDRGRGIAKRGDAWVHRTFNAVLRVPGRGRAGDHRGAARAAPGAGPAAGAQPGQVLRRHLPGRSPAARHARGDRPDHARDNAGDWRISRPHWTLTEDWLGAPADHDDVRGGLRRAGPALAAHASGRAPRPTSSGGWARPRPSYAARWPSSARSRSRSTDGRRLPAARRPRRRPRAGAVGGPAAGARPHHDGLEAACLLPRRRRRPAPVRQQRQRRHDRLVERPHRRLLGPGPGRAWSGRAPRATSAPTALPRSRPRRSA